MIIGPFAYIDALATDGWRIYGATPAGLITYDAVTRRWELPLTLEDGYPVRERPAALVALRGEGALVLGTALGTLWRIEPAARRIERLGSVPGAVQRITSGEFGTLFIRTARGWFRLEPGSAFPEQLAGEPAGAADALDARMQALRGRIGLDARMRRWPITAWTAGSRRDEIFVGLGGGGMVRVDAMTLEVTPLPYGLGSRGVGAVAQFGDQVWFGGDGTGRESANLANADTALARWRWPGEAGDDLPRGYVSAIASHGGRVWVGAQDGLFAIDASTGRSERLRTSSGLPSERVRALLPHDSVLWVGTERGACAWQGSGCGPTLLPGQTISALSACGRTLWLGTEQGLYAAGSEQAAGRIDTPGLQAGPIQALACMADTLFVATGQNIWVNRAGEWHGPLPLAGRGTLRTLAVQGSTLWVGGDGGLATWDAVAGRWTYYIAPRDVPLSPVWWLWPAGPYLWLGTPGGALRLDVRRR